MHYELQIEIYELRYTGYDFQIYKLRVQSYKLRH